MGMKKRMESLLGFDLGVDVNYKDEYCPMLCEHMARGHGFSSFGAVIGVPVYMLNRWLEKYEDFKEARDIGHLCQLKKWEEILIMQSDGSINGNSASLKMAVTNFFPDEFKDKQSVEHGGNVVYKIETGIDEDKASKMEYIDGEFKVVDEKDSPEEESPEDCL